jgi:glycosyltransferase involved in cell wall biosynthesis
VTSNRRNSPLRIACYGFADPQAGSVSTAGFLILRQLLERGHQIDFFNKTSFVRPRELETLPNYRFVEVPTPISDRIMRRCPKRGGTVLRHLLGQMTHRVFAARILETMRRHHAESPYDLQLWLGDWSWGRIGEIPVVSWVQGPPETDARSVVRLKKQIVRLCGWRAYLPLRMYAAYRGTLGLPRFDCTDLFIVGSEWSRKILSSYGIPSQLIHAMAYPVDLKQFSPATEYPPDGRPTILWIGRTVPRKRLDLFLDACCELTRSGIDPDVMVIGGFDFTPGYAKLLEQFPSPHRLRHIPSLPREQVISLLQTASVVVQPSEEENFGSTIAEALACGTPVVVGPSNGTGDYIADGGVRFAEYRPESVADAISRALQNRTTLRQKARQAAEAAFDTARIADDLIGLLHKTTAQKSFRDLVSTNSSEAAGASTEKEPTTLNA